MNYFTYSPETVYNISKVRVAVSYKPSTWSKLGCDDMKIEKINDNQIRCTLTKEDLADRQIKISELAYGTDKAKSLFRDMMQQAAYEFGFEANDIPLMIEAIPISSESIILIITKVEDPEELDTRFAKFAPSSGEENGSSNVPVPTNPEGADDILDLFNKLRDARKKAVEKKAPAPKATQEVEPPLNLTRLYRFQDLDSVLQAAQVLKSFYNGTNSLYKDAVRKEYLLVISKSDHSPEEFNKVCNILSEYAANAKYVTAMEAYFEEHMDCISSGAALQKLAALQ